MKAKVIATGEVVEVILNNRTKDGMPIYRDIHVEEHEGWSTGREWFDYELDFIGVMEVGGSNHTERFIDWEQRRFELVKVVITETYKKEYGYCYEHIAEQAIKLADAIIEKLKTN